MWYGFHDIDAQLSSELRRCEMSKFCNFVDHYIIKKSIICWMDKNSTRSDLMTSQKLRLDGRQDNEWRSNDGGAKTSREYLSDWSTIVELLVAQNKRHYCGGDEVMHVMRTSQGNIPKIGKGYATPNHQRIDLLMGS